MAWTVEMEYQLRKWWDEDGKSASQIAALLGNGITRSAVIGKVHRLHLSSRVVIKQKDGKFCFKPTNVRKAPSPTVAKPLPVPVTQPRILRALHTQMQTALEDDMPKAKPIEGGVALLDLLSHHCRWPVTSPERGQADLIRFCGANKDSGSSYCKAHRAIAVSGVYKPYTKPPKVRYAQFEEEAA